MAYRAGLSRFDAEHIDWTVVGVTTTTTKMDRTVSSKGGQMAGIDSNSSPGHKGKAPPDKGKAPPDKGKGSGSAQVILGSVTEGAACVVLRASVETFGPTGDAELNFHVKWPGTTLAAGEICPSDTSSNGNGQSCDGGGIDASSGNLYLPATRPTPPKES